MTVLRELWYCHVAVLSFHASSSSNPPRFPCAYPFLSDFRGQFWRSSGTQNGSCGISSESSRRPLSNDIKFRSNGGMLSANREFHVVAGVIHLSNAPGLADQLVASRKDSAREGGSCAAYFCKVPDSRKSELGLVRYGPANRGHRGVFGPFEGSFPIGIPTGPDKILAIREFHVVHGCVFFPMCPGSQINLLRVRKTLRASVDNVGGEIPELSAKPYFVGLFSRAWPCTEASLGSQDMILRTEAVGMFLHAKGTESKLFIRSSYLGQGSGQFDSVFRSGQRSGQTLVKLGQPWSNLVTWSKLSKPWEMYPGPRFEDFLGIVGPSRVRKRLRSNLGQTWSTPVKLGQPWSNFGECALDPVLRLFAWRALVGSGRLGSGCLVLRADTRENPGGKNGVMTMSPRRNRPTWFGLPRFACRHPRKSRGTLIDDQSSPTRPIAANRVVSTVWNLSPNRLRSDLTWGLPKLQIGWFQRFGISVQTAANRVVSTVWNLSPNRLRGDLTWELPKLQIGWFQRCKSGTNRPGPPRSRNEICDPGPNRSGPPSPRNGDELGTNRPGPPRSRNEICDSGPNRSGPPSPRNGDELGTNRPSPSRSRNGICDSGPNRSGPPSPRNGDELGTNRPGPPRSRNEICDSGPNRSGPPSPRNGDELGTNRPGPPRSRNGICDSTFCQSRNLAMSDRGSGSGGHRRSDRLAKGKAVAYAPESSPDTDDEYGAMEDVRTRLDASLARNLQAELDAEAAGLAPSAARPPPRPGVVIGRSARPSETTRSSPQPGVTTGPSDAPSAAPRRPHTRSTGIPPSRLKRQRTEGIPDSAGTIPEDYVAPGFRYPPHGGIRPRYPVAVEISDTPLLTNLLAHPSSLVRRCQEPPDSAGRGGCIPYVSVYHPAVWCFIERFFHHTGTFHLSTCEMAVLPVDWSAILGIRFGGRAPPSEPIDGFEAREILGLADRDAIEGVRRPSVRIRHLADVLRRDREEPPTELRYRQWVAYFIFSCFLGNDRSIVLTPIVGMFRDIDTLREYDWGALTYGFYIRGLRRYSRRESISFLGFWQFTVFWAFEHFPTFAPSLLPLASDPSAGSWELLLGERTVRQLGDEAVVPVDPSPLMTIEAYIPRAPSDPYIAGVEGGRVMGGVAMDSHLIRSSGQIERLESEVLRLQLELSVSVDRHTADMDRVQGEMASMQTEAIQMRRDLASRDAEVARLAAAVRRLEEQLQGMGITPVTGADLSGLGQPSSSPPRDPVSRDWFFDDPPSS
uniref:Aminotransferase-like plant mobile domain-containing protein n=1 Tax=Fagus sylvatica TaxID=28930 RepID=A0A2N9GXZ6_FAGSY